MGARGQAGAFAGVSGTRDQRLGGPRLSSSFAESPASVCQPLQRSWRCGIDRQGFGKEIRRFRRVAMRQLEHSEVRVRRRVARVEIQRGTECPARRINIALAGLNSPGQILRWRKLRVGANGELNRPRCSGEILVKELSRGRVVMGATTARKDVPEARGDGIEGGGVAGVRI